MTRHTYKVWAEVFIGDIEARDEDHAKRQIEEKLRKKGKEFRNIEAEILQAYTIDNDEPEEY